MKNERPIKFNWKLVTGIILLAAATRIVLPPSNFAPMNAIAVFSGTYFAGLLSALFVPLAAIFISDQAVNFLYFGKMQMFYEGWYWQYGAYLLLSCVGMVLKNRVSGSTVVTSSLVSSLIFFFVTNFGVWASTNLYPRTLDGLALCFTAAVPFFGATLFGDLLFFALMFGSVALVGRRFMVPASGTASI